MLRRGDECIGSIYSQTRIILLPEKGVTYLRLAYHILWLLRGHRPEELYHMSPRQVLPDTFNILILDSMT